MMEAIEGQQLSYCDLSDKVLEPQPAVIVVCGATGDLAHRKIFPAFYNLERLGTMPETTKIVGFARRELGTAEFIDAMHKSVIEFSHSRPIDEAVWNTLAQRITYVQGDIENGEAYAKLATHLSNPEMPHNKLFYLAISPEQFAVTARLIADAGLGSAKPAATGSGFRRLVVEKPFGSDLPSARSLNSLLQQCFAEEDIFRIDHYLGKETVQNLLYLRFANSIFEPLWNQNHIEAISIDVLETGGIGSRGGYYDSAGAARDMMQNHIIQLLCLTAMEPPVNLDPESIRNEKVKVLKSIPDYTNSDMRSRSMRGQYTAGRAPDGIIIPSYINEPKIHPKSKTETFASLRLEVENWRFAGVPITLTTGKAVNRQVSEIRVKFKRPPATLFAGYCGDLLQANMLTLRIQPNEGMWLSFNGKVPGAARLVSKELRFSYSESKDEYLPEAYERLLADALAGDSTLFIRSDETEEAWRIIDTLKASWSADTPLWGYQAGSAGPKPDSNTWGL